MINRWVRLCLVLLALVAIRFAVFESFVPVIHCKEADKFKENMNFSPKIKQIIDQLTVQIPGSHYELDLHKLEAVLGSLKRDKKEEAFGLSRDKGRDGIRDIWISFAIDQYHRDVFKVENPHVKNYRLIFPNGWRYCLNSLRKKYGPERIYKQGEKKIYRFTTGKEASIRNIAAFYLSLEKGDGFQFEWQAELPAFAIPIRNQAENDLLAKRVIAFLKGPITRQRVLTIFDKFGPLTDSGSDIVKDESWRVTLVPAGQNLPKQFEISFWPALNGNDIIKALGFKDPVVISGDVHMIGRTVIDNKNRDFELKINGYRITIEVSKDNLKSTSQRRGPSPVWRTPIFKILSIIGRQG